MTDGTFKTWELFALISGAAVLAIYGFLGKFADIEGAAPIYAAFTLMSSALFAKPVWLLGNWREIRNWERTTATVTEGFYTQHRRGMVHYHIGIEFTSRDGRVFRKTLHNVAFRFKKGQKRDIMFAEEYIDALIFVPQAFRQAAISAAAGALLEITAVMLML